MTTVAKELEFATVTDITTLVKSIQSQHPPSGDAMCVEIQRIAECAGRKNGEIARLAFKQLCRRANGSLLAVQGHACYKELLRLRDTF